MTFARPYPCYDLSVHPYYLVFNLWAYSANDFLITFFLFFVQKIGFDILSKLFQQETICKKFQRDFKRNGR